MRNLHNKIGKGKYNIKTFQTDFTFEHRYKMQKKKMLAILFWDTPETDPKISIDGQ